MPVYTFSKAERVCHKRDVDKLFAGPNSYKSGPLLIRVLLRDRAEGEPVSQILISVPKRILKSAVARNRVKRQLREIYRHQKPQSFLEIPDGKILLVGLIYLGSPKAQFAALTRDYSKGLIRVYEKVLNKN